MNRIRTIYTVFHKNFIQTMRYSTWILGFVIWPLLFPLLYILSAYGMAGPDKSGLSVFQSATGASNYAAYIMVGTIVWENVNSIMWGYGSFLRDEQLRGTLESNWLCPINKFDFLIGGGLMELVMSVACTAVSIVEYRFIYGIHFTGSILSWVLVYAIMIPGVFGIGMLFSSIILWVKEVNAAVNVVRGIIMIMCGISFPISVMPHTLQVMAKFLPFTYGIEISRQIMVKSENLYSASHNIFMCLFEGIIILILGRISFLAMEKKVRDSGSLERF